MTTEIKISEQSNVDVNKQFSPLLKETKKDFPEILIPRLKELLST
jgi:hypothetical protein